MSGRSKSLQRPRNVNSGVTSIMAEATIMRFGHI